MSHSYNIKRVDYKGGMKEVQEFVDAYHSYINYADRPSRKMYYLLFENESLVGVFGLSSAFTRPKLIREFMTKHNIKYNEMANNIVFCMHGHKSRNAGSKFLSMLRKDAVKWWKERYGDDLKAFQTFVLPPRNGAVYKADNWIELGFTTGIMRRTITIKKSEYESNPDKYPKIIIRHFKNGETKYMIDENVETEKKLIFVKPTKKLKESA